MATVPLANNPAAIPERAGIGKVVVEELEEIARRHDQPNNSLDPNEQFKSPLDKDNWKQNCHERKLFGICISGGGIRSATFGLGALQGLAKKKLLSRAHYISTVSGGGYIGAWLQGIARREPNYEQVLDPQRPPDLAAKDPITFLRKYSNYLAPRNGLSLDALVIPLIWFRNMMLNQAIIISAIMAIYILLLAPGAAVRHMATDTMAIHAGIMLVASILAAAYAVGQIGSGLRRIVHREFDQPSQAGIAQGVPLEQHVAWQVVTPLFAAVLLLIFALSAHRAAFGLGRTGGFIAGYVVLLVLVLLLQIGGGFTVCYIRQRKDVGASVRPWLPWVHVIWMSLVTAGFLLVLVEAVWHLCGLWKLVDPMGSQLVIAWAPPLYFLALIVGIGLHIGLMGRDFPDASREWLARLGALILTYIIIWAALFALAIFAPLGLADLCVVGKRWLLASGTGAWLLSTIMSVLAGKSSKAGDLNPDEEQNQSSTIDLVARYGPFIAVPGFLAIVAFGTQLLLHRLPWNAIGGLLNHFRMYYWTGLPYNAFDWRYPLLLLFFLVLVFVVLSYRVNINEFSMHHFYKNRLVRCYLGASATKTRSADAFTGFDPKDDMALFTLRYKEDDKQRPPTPYPIVNATLTVTAGVELATQERKALPWFFAPLYSGFYPARSDEDRVARDPEAKYCYADSKILGQGVDLGTATAISGAAVNPNMGYHSAPQTAFLLTLFNVRLGWWLGNPINKNAFLKPGPTFALWWLMRELLGFVDEGSKFINLSDGGHFENLGLYELVRRRCHHVIVIDAEEDPDYVFESLGGAVRKCREDFGVEIQIDPRPIIPDPKFSRTHCVMGRIKYPKEENAAPGFLLYLKSSISGDEPADVEEYRRENPAFPQQSTAEQFFSESQFESYRRLGLHVAETALDHVSDDPEQSLKAVFQRLRSEWLLPPAAPEGAAARHGEAYGKLLAELAKSPESDELVLKNPPADIGEAGPQRNSFFLHLQLLHFIEEVFLELDFSNKDKWKHPANEGWRELITYWAERPTMREVWVSQRETYGQPFRDRFDELVGFRE